MTSLSWKERVEKMAKWHCWSDRAPAEAYECGFEAGAEFGRAECKLEVLEMLRKCAGQADGSQWADWIEERLK